MGVVRDFAAERLVVAVLSSSGTGAGEAARLEEALAGSFGPTLRRGPALDFPWTDYYRAEMGGGLGRSFLALERLVDPSRLAGIKLECCRIEGLFAEAGARRFNLDPGLLSPGRFVLASTKASPHRIPLGEGIHAELTLVYERGEYRPLPWTYPDWASPEYRDFLAGLRPALKEALRALSLNRVEAARA